MFLKEGKEEKKERRDGNKKKISPMSVWFQIAIKERCSGLLV